jgi:hypothetical protein
MIKPKIDCEICSGCGLTEEQRTCPCVRAQELTVRIRQAVDVHGKLFHGLAIPKPRIAFSSPLVAAKRARAECMIIRAEWPTLMRAILACVVVESVRDLKVFTNEWNLRVTSDLKIRESYFSDGGQAHLKVVEGADLLVVRLGMSASNKATRDALFEVISLADGDGVPVWLVEHPARPFGEGHPTWSQDIGELINGWPRLNLVAPEQDPKKVSVADLVKASEVKS